VITYAIFKYSASKPSAPVQTATAAPTPTTPLPVEQVPTPQAVPTKTPEEAAQELNAQDLAQARDLFAAGQPAVALREHLQPLLERSPDNAEALELKRQIEQAMARPTTKSAPPPVARAEPDIDGVTRRPNEPYDDYQARAKRLSSGIIDGKNALDKTDYATAVARFRAVASDQPHYMGVDGLLSDALDKQRVALEEAIKTGQKAEQAGAWKTARQWYQRAQEIDPTSTTAKTNHAAVYSRLNTMATSLLNEASFAVKSGDTQLALGQYQRILDLLSPGDEMWEKAKKESELLKK
jgi:tetratricopeptide (TPR) repeat protein